jgi:hypothetical protein
MKNVCWYISSIVRETCIQPSYLIQRFGHEEYESLGRTKNWQNNLMVKICCYLHTTEIVGFDSGRNRFPCGRLTK